MADTEITSPSRSRQGRLRRAARACLSCRARKVRCDVVENSPCSNCKQDLTKCIVPRTRRSRKYLPEMHNPAEPDSSHQTVYCEADDDRALTIATRLNDSTQEQSSVETRSTVNSISSADPSPSDPDPEVAAFLQPLGDVKPSYKSFLFTEGALSLPNTTLQSELLKSYIDFSYPRMPAVDLGALCRAVNPGDGSGGQISIVLYQAILFAGSAHVSSKVVEENGWPSKIALRRELCRRVELLLELGTESNDIIRTQVALLLTSQSVNQKDNKDSWYWVNTAITIALSLGLHEDLDNAEFDNERRLRRRLWWCCYVRDKIVSLGLGRPSRIKSDSFNVTPLHLENLEFGVLSGRRVLLGCIEVGPHDPSLQVQSAELLIEKTKLSVIIEQILQATVQRTLLPAKTFEKLDASLRSWQTNLPQSCRLQPGLYATQRDNMTISNHLRQHMLHMVYHTAVYTLHRPRFLPNNTRASLTIEATPQDREVSRGVVLDAVEQITRLAAQLHQCKLDSNLPMPAITVICPAIFMHILNMRSRVRAKRESAVLSFRVCMRLIERLRDLYPSVDSTITYLEAVLRKAYENGMPLFSTSLSDIFNLNKTDRTDIYAILGRNNQERGSQPAPLSEGAVGLSGLASLLSAGVACDGEFDVEEVADFEKRRIDTAQDESCIMNLSPGLGLAMETQGQLEGNQGDVGSFSWTEPAIQDQMFFGNGMQGLDLDMDLDAFSL